MTTGISGITPPFYQDIYPAAYLASGARNGMAVSAFARIGHPAQNRDEAQFSAEGAKLAKEQELQQMNGAGRQLSEDEQRQVDELEKSDQRVRAHEQAHIAAGGGLTSGGAKFQYKTGPDGKQYAVGGEVQIDTTEEKDPNATIRKAQRVKAAALAPADPSAQDRSVAATADAMATKARQELGASQVGSKVAEGEASLGSAAEVVRQGNGRKVDTPASESAIERQRGGTKLDMETGVAVPQAAARQAYGSRQSASAARTLWLA